MSSKKKDKQKVNRRNIMPGQQTFPALVHCQPPSSSTSPKFIKDTDITREEAWAFNQRLSRAERLTRDDNGVRIVYDGELDKLKFRRAQKLQQLHDLCTLLDDQRGPGVQSQTDQERENEDALKQYRDEIDQLEEQIQASSPDAFGSAAAIASVEVFD